MAEPVSITASLLAIITVAIQSTNTLKEVVQRFKERNKTLRRLQDELEDLSKILNLLKSAVDTDASVLALLEGPVGRCSKLCREFEDSIKAFAAKSKIGFRDWTKMEFKRGDINEFIETLAGYKSTISVGLGTITMLVAVTRFH
jgi:DNA repair ATPase RecN